MVCNLLPTTEIGGNWLSLTEVDGAAATTASGTAGASLRHSPSDSLSVKKFYKKPQRNQFLPTAIS